MKRLIRKAYNELDKIKSTEELLKWMNENIQYGYMDKNNKIHKGDFDSDEETMYFFNNYRLQTPEELLKNKFGVCWDQAELQRFIFDKLNIKNYVIYMIQNNPDYSTHSYSVIEEDNKFYWFENSWYNHRGFHGPFKSIKEIATLVHDNAIKEDGHKDNGWEYGILSKPNYGIGCMEYMKFAGNCIHSKFHPDYEGDSDDSENGN